VLLCLRLGTIQEGLTIKMDNTPLRFILKNGTACQFDYTNYKGVSRKRVVVALNISFESTTYYPKTQFILNAFCLEKKDTRGFAMEKIQNFEVIKHPATEEI
jgi:predicted DNA-binding transcriptional regulator YafY